MVNKGSPFTNFVRFRPHTYTRIQQSLPPLWAEITLTRHKQVHLINLYYFDGIACEFRFLEFFRII